MDPQVRQARRRGARGRDLTYYVNVTNFGPSAAQPFSVTLDDVLASDGTFTVTGFTSDRAMSCTTFPTPGIGVPIDKLLRVSCTLNELLDVNEEWNLTIDVTADETQTLNNVADVEIHGAVDPDQSNNHAEVEHDITDVSDLTLTKTAEGTVGGCDAYTMPARTRSRRAWTYVHA